MQIAGQNTCGKFPKESLQEAGYGVGIPVLIRREQIHVTL